MRKFDRIQLFEVSSKQARLVWGRKVLAETKVKLDEMGVGCGRLESRGFAQLVQSFNPRPTNFSQRWWEVFAQTSQDEASAFCKLFLANNQSSTGVSGRQKVTFEKKVKEGEEELSPLWGLTLIRVLQVWQRGLYYESTDRKIITLK